MRQRPDQLSARETNLAPVLARASEALLRALTDLKAAGYQEGQTEFAAALLQLQALGKTIQEKERSSKS
ncbi:MAG TPA: hypothetical protein VKA15_07265 [Isosphaeraceae bacterium]|nr:hypothetical protein [Isosphaeraceae bacterium]